MNFTYENQGTNTYLVYTLSEKEALDSMSLGMITNNRIPGLASAIFTQMNDNRCIKYNVSSKISLSQLFSGSVNRKRLLGVFQGIADAVLSAEEYMIDARSVILDPDYIYADVSTCGTVLVCLPVKGKAQETVDFDAFFRNIMFHIRFDQTENGDYVTRLINYLNGTPVFSMSDFRELLTTLLAADVSDRSGQPAVQSDMRFSAQAERERQPEAKAAERNRRIMQSQLPLPEKAAEAALASLQKPMPQIPSIPGRQPGSPSGDSTDESAQEGKEGGSGRPMSIMYLLQHYNKENAAAYKAQKAEKKQAKAKGKSTGTVFSDQAAPHAGPSLQMTSERQGAVSYPSFPIPGQQVAPENCPPPGKQGGIPSAGRANAGEEDVACPQDAEKRKTGCRADFGDTVYKNMADEGSGTVMLIQNTVGLREKPRLLRRKNNEVIPLNKAVFRIGRNEEFNDYAITDNECIGKSHCHIITRDNQYFIVDDNSKNHTYVDGNMVSAGSEVRLSHGQSICLADEEFEFKLL